MSNPNDDGLAIAKAAIHANPFKDALYSGKVAVSIAAFTSANYSIGQIAANAGFQAVMVDMEHSMVGFEKAAEIFAGALSAG
jgi:2-keto-3-deoxy-L-rhamnonate aldolase RhmA